MIKRLLLLGFLLSSFHFFGQCPTGDITLASQADVDNFAVLYPGCTELNVKLSIGGPLSEDDITDLSPLSGLTKILGDDSGLNITNCSLLTSLEGLNNLTEVSVQVLIFNTGVVNVDALTNLTTAGALRVDENDAIENLDGFQNVTTVVGRISVTDNPVLTSIAGLSGITNVAGGVTINNNPNVPNLSGLENIESAGFVLDINDMDLITNIDELSGLVSASDVFIRNNDALTDITGLSTYTNGGLYFVNNNSLTTISGLTSYVGGPEETLGIDQNDVLANVNLDGITSLKFASFFDNPQLTALPDLSGITIRGFGIGECDLITSFAGLEGLQGIDEFILIQDNPNLEDISALADAEIIGTDLVFNIMGNTSLSECEIASFCAYIDSGGTIDISGNVPGCNSQAEVESVCGGCPPGSVVLTTQAEVDNFAVMYPGCTTINGSLRIDGPDIVDLTPLASLTTIEDGPFLGNLIIQNCTSLASLDGLNNISLVSAGFSLLQNPLLTDLLGMEGLTSVNSLTIFDNPLLTEITALSNVTGSSGISIGSNNSLLNLNGLEGITSAGIIEVFDNAVMTSIGGLSGLTDAPISISIGSMPSLENFSGLEGLTDLSSAFVQILDCDAIFDLEGLQNLTHLGGLSLVGNGQLNTIGALDGVTFVDPLAFSNIEDNPNLAVCDIVSLCTYFTGGGSFTIANNAPGCNSQAEVEAACAACPTTDVFLTSQAEVDAFFATATACTDLEVGLSIAGADIVDLTPLSGLNSVRTLTIADNPLLTNLSGLETLTTMATDDFGLIIQNNTALEDITALSGLTGTIGFSIVIQDNPALLSLDGLQNITNPSDDDVVIINNDALVNLQGLNSITTTDDMIIRDNDNLLSLDGLDSFSFTGTLEIGNNDQLASLDGLTAFDTLFGLSIYDNAVLTDISGLDSASFDPGFLGLSITNNPLLAVCNTELICGFLVVAGDADATIADNAPGCDSREEVEDSCRVCPTADLVLTSQAEVDAFADTYRFCDNLDVKLTISGADIDDLSGLAQITVLSAGFEVSNNPILTSFIGLSPIALNNSSFIVENNPALVELSAFNGTVGFPGFRIINNDNLLSLSGLDGITASFDLIVEDNLNLPSLVGLDNLALIEDIISIRNNNQLLNLTGLEGFSGVLNEIQINNNFNLLDLTGIEGLTAVQDGINIQSNSNLISLDGIQNCINATIEPLYGLQIINNNALVDISALSAYNPNAVGGVEIVNNDNLSLCASEFLCDYLDLGTGSATISGNLPAGFCETVEAVIEACGLSVSEFDFSTISLSPNPTAGVFSIEGLDGLDLMEVDLFSLSGQKLMQVNSTTVDISSLAAGIYFVQIKTEAGIAIKRLIKQ